MKRINAKRGTAYRGHVYCNASCITPNKNIFGQRGAIYEGDIHEHFFIAALCSKGCRCVTQGKNRIFITKFILILQPKKGVVHEGVIHEALLLYKLLTAPF